MEGNNPERTESGRLDPDSQGAFGLMCCIKVEATYFAKSIALPIKRAKWARFLIDIRARSPWIVHHLNPNLGNVWHSLACYNNGPLPLLLIEKLSALSICTSDLEAKLEGGNDPGQTSMCLTKTLGKVYLNF